jgi:mRNA interferase MazF
MHKNYAVWTPVKVHLHNDTGRLFFHEREVWWCSLGENIGFEQDGKGSDFVRPVIVLRKFNNEVFWALPLTTQEKSGKYYFPVDLGDGKARKIILSQLRIIDAKRLVDKIAVVPCDTYDELKNAVIRLLL